MRGGRPVPTANPRSPEPRSGRSRSSPDRAHVALAELGRGGGGDLGVAHRQDRAAALGRRKAEVGDDPRRLARVPDQAVAMGLPELLDARQRLRRGLADALFHRGVDLPGVERGHGHAAALQLEREHAGELVHGGLGRAVRAPARARLIGGAVGDGHEPAVVAIEHAGQHGAGDEIRAADVDREVAQPRCAAGLGQRTDRIEDPGVVDEDRRWSDPALGREYELLHLALIGEVGGRRERLAAGLLDRDGHLVELGRVPRRDDDARAEPRQGLGDRPAEPAPAAGDDRDLAQQERARHAVTARCLDRTVASASTSLSRCKAQNEMRIASADSSATCLITIRSSSQARRTISAAPPERGCTTTMPVGSSARPRRSSGRSPTAWSSRARSACTRSPTRAPRTRWTASAWRTPTNDATSTVPISKRVASSLRVMWPARSWSVRERHPTRLGVQRPGSATQVAPVANGPCSHLWPRNTAASAPRARTSMGSWPRACAQSTMLTAPAARARPTAASTGSRRPVRHDTSDSTMAWAPSRNACATSERNRSSSRRATTRTRSPRSCRRYTGRSAAGCSSAVVTMSAPGPTGSDAMSVFRPSVADWVSAMRDAPSASPMNRARSARVSLSSALYESYPTCENIPTPFIHVRYASAARCATGNVGPEPATLKYRKSSFSACSASTLTSGRGSTKVMPS